MEEVRYSDATGEVLIRLKDTAGMTFRSSACACVTAESFCSASPNVRLPLRPPFPAASRGTSRLLALAFRLEQMLENGAVDDMAELARLGRVSTARVNQILNLRYLAPDIQERLLLFPPTCNRDIVTEREIRAIAVEPSWGCQRRLFEEVLKGRGGTEPASSVPVAG